MMAVKDHLVTKVRVSLCRRAVYFFDNNGLRHSQSHTRNKNMYSTLLYLYEERSTI